MSASKARCPETLLGLGYPCGRQADPRSPGGRCSFHSTAAGELRSQKVVTAGDEAEVRPGVVAKPGHPLCFCGCGDPVYARSMGYACYHRQYRRVRAARQAERNAARARQVRV